MRAPPQSVTTAHGAVEVAMAGEGPALLAIHGGMGGYDQGEILAQAIAGPDLAVRSLYPSRPGYLRTPAGENRDPASQADLHAALLDALAVDRAVVAAVSAGGPSAIAFAARYPSRCAGLILVSACTGPLDIPPGAARRLPMIRLAARLPPLAALLALLARLNPEAAARRSILDPQVVRRTLADPQAGPLMRAMQERAASRLRERLDATLSDIAQFKAMAPLPLRDIAAPVLAIHGTADRVVPLSHVERVAREVPGADILQIPGGEHVCLFTHLAEVRARVAAFLAGLRLDV